MKSLFFSTLFALCCSFLFPACDKGNDNDGGKSCETVVNANGPAFLKVINNRDDEILVDLTSIIPFGAQMQSGACEIYGLPTGDHTITIEKADGSTSKDVDISLSNGATYTFTVGDNFF